MPRYIVEIELIPELPYEAQKEIEEAVKSIIKKYMEQMLRVVVVRREYGQQKPEERTIELLPE